MATIEIYDSVTNITITNLRTAVENRVLARKELLRVAEIEKLEAARAEEKERQARENAILALKEMCSKINEAAENGAFSIVEYWGLDSKKNLGITFDDFKMAKNKIFSHLRTAGYTCSCHEYSNSMYYDGYVMIGWKKQK